MIGDAPLGEVEVGAKMGIAEEMVKPFLAEEPLDIVKGEMDFENCLSTTKATYEYMERTGCRPRPGDVLLAISTSGNSRN